MFRRLRSKFLTTKNWMREYSLRRNKQNAYAYRFQQLGDFSIKMAMLVILPMLPDVKCSIDVQFWCVVIRGFLCIYSSVLFHFALPAKSENFWILSRNVIFQWWSLFRSQYNTGTNMISENVCSMYHCYSYPFIHLIHTN